MFNSLASDPSKCSEPRLVHLGQPADSSGSQPTTPEIPYAPYSEKPALSEVPYTPYAEPSANEAPYEPYKGI
jgi:hypothetical protein